ncbi:MAG: MerR family transcriptional regulator [Aristaeellaceae bacterium]
MKEACQQVGMGYEALKFYCNEGLVPGVKRDERNRRLFDDSDIAWIRGLICLKKCGMSMAQMKEYLSLCLLGEGSIPQRQAMLAQQRELLLARQAELQASLDFIDRKQQFYRDVQEGRTPYRSNLTRPAAADAACSTTKEAVL